MSIGKLGIAPSIRGKAGLLQLADISGSTTMHIYVIYDISLEGPLNQWISNTSNCKLFRYSNIHLVTTYHFYPTHRCDMGTEVLSRQLRSHRGNNSRSSTWPSKAEWMELDTQVSSGKPAGQQNALQQATQHKNTKWVDTHFKAVPVATTVEPSHSRIGISTYQTWKTHALPVSFPMHPTAPCVCSSSHVTTALMPFTVEATSKCAPKLLVPISTMKVTPGTTREASTLLVSPPIVWSCIRRYNP